MICYQCRRKTGRAMIAAFAAAGEPVRAMMRQPEKDEELIALGAAEVSHGDLANTGMLRRRRKGAGRSITFART